MKGVAEPDHFRGLVIGDECGEALSDVGVAPSRKEITAGAMSFGVAPVEIGDDQEAREGEPEREARVDPVVGKEFEKQDADVVFEDDIYQLTIYALGYETVETPLGRFKTLKLEPRMEKTPPLGMFRRGSKVHVWIAVEDPRRLPVKFEVEFKFGAGVSTLIDYQPPESSAK